MNEKKTVLPSRTHFLTAHDQWKKNTSDLWSDSALNILQTCQDATGAFDTTWRRSCARIAPFWHDMPPARPWGPVDELMGGGALVSWCISVLALPQAILKRCNLQVYLYITLYNAFQLISIYVYANIYIYLWLCVCVSKNWKSARLISPTGTSRLTSSASVTSVIFQLLLHRGCGHPHLSPQTAQMASLSHSRAKSSWNPTPKYTAKVVQLEALKRKMQLAIDLFKNTAESRNPTTSNPTQCWKMALVMRLWLKYSAKDGQKMFTVVLPHVGAPCTPTPPQTNCRRWLVLWQRSWLC